MAQEVGQAGGQRGDTPMQGLQGCQEPSAMTFAQSGEASHEAVWACAMRIEELLLEKGVVLARVKRVRHVVIELLENVMHYGELVHDEQCRRYEVEVWREERGGVELFCSNLVRESDVPAFSDYLKRVCSYTVSEAKQAVREALLSDVGLLSGGAGIGLLTVRQRAAGIKWSFVPAGEKRSRYTIALKVL